ncbi:kinase [Paucisalibacillus sp. EB02]|uniref:GHMP family kinase ATP-binding protein n=1 Tax=Paucisalibacillus sp. EB02 TaxID=1347087 RepID=UPI001E4BD44F|nr:kinase [Paucisalibacillus sp. EB02]
MNSKILNVSVNENVRNMDLLVGHGSSFGTFGELLQGVLEETPADFLVTFPIDLYSYAAFTVSQNTDDLSVIPAEKKKSVKLAKLILNHYGLPLRGELKIRSDIPIGKGLASSSADLVATARAIENCYDFVIPKEQLEKFLYDIEPGDGVMYDGIISFYNREVKLIKYLGSLPSLVIVGFDEGGMVDTSEINNNPKPFTLLEKKEYKTLLIQLEHAINSRNLKQVGEVSTKSAILNQKLIPKKHLDSFVEICKAVDGLGVVVAHTGTYIGLLLSSEDRRYSSQLEQVRNMLQNLVGELPTIFHSLEF